MYVDLRGLVWTNTGGVVPFASAYGGSLSGNPYTTMINGRVAIIYGCIGYHYYDYGGILVNVFDADGNVCSFKSADYTGYTTTFQTNTFQTGNSFMVLFSDMGRQVTFTVPDVFTPGGEFVLETSSAIAPASPCGSGDFYGTTYLAAQNLIVNEYLQAFSLASNQWASVYDGAGNLKGAGFIGNFGTGVPGFNQFTQTLPPYVDGSEVHYKSGYYVFMNGNSAGYGLQVFGFSKPTLVGDYTQLACGVPSDSVRIVGKNTATVSVSGMGYPGSYVSDSVIPAGYCDIDGLFVLPGYNAAIPASVIVTPYSMLSFNTPASYPFSVCVDSANKKIYCVLTDGQYNGTNKSGPIYVTDFNPADYPALTYPPIATSSQNSLINFHRPISPKGSFLA